MSRSVYAMTDRLYGLPVTAEGLKCDRCGQVIIDDPIRCFMTVGDIRIGAHGGLTSEEVHKIGEHKYLTCRHASGDRPWGIVR